MTTNINICDIVIILVILVFVYGGYKRGLVRSFFGLFKTIASIILAGQAYPYISKLLRSTGGLYDMINNAVRSGLHFGDPARDPITGAIESGMQGISGSLKEQIDLINGLALPQFLKDSLISSNNPVIYEALNVEGIYDYISGFLSNICINIIGWILAFIVVSILLEVLVNMLDLIAKLPIIRTFNKLGGLIIGFLQATLFVWIGHVVIVLFFSAPSFAALSEMLDTSMFASLFFEHNLILEIINKYVM